jgi:mRNA-degrading endonuclease RelE of RelBE toxin-antitoxin system
MPELVPSKKFTRDLDAFRTNKPIRKKIAKALATLRDNPHHPGLGLERIVNDPTAWSVRIDRKYRISFDPGGTLPPGTPDWSAPVTLLRVLDHDDLYKFPR